MSKGENGGNSAPSAGDVVARINLHLAAAWCPVAMAVSDGNSNILLLCFIRLDKTNEERTVSTKAQFVIVSVPTWWTCTLRCLFTCSDTWFRSFCSISYLISFLSLIANCHCCCCSYYCEQYGHPVHTNEGMSAFAWTHTCTFFYCPLPLHFYNFIIFLGNSIADAAAPIAR